MEVVDALAIEEVKVIESLFDNNGREVFARKPEILQQLETFIGPLFLNNSEKIALKMFLATAKINVISCGRQSVLAHIHVATPKDMYKIAMVIDPGVVVDSRQYLIREIPRYVAYDSSGFRQINFASCKGKVGFKYLNT